MHYIVDGYNLLFYLFGCSFSDFKAQRQSLIQSMNAKIEFLALDVTLVFDSHLCPGEGSRSHYHHLEILFTPEGVTADDLIISCLKLSRTAAKEVLITNDRELSQRAKHLFANTQSIEYFLNWLDRRYSNKKHGKSKPLGKFKSSIEINPATAVPSQSPSRLKSSLTPSLMPLASSRIDKSVKELQAASEQLPLPPEQPAEIEGSFEYYLSSFQTAHEAILKAEQAAKIEKKKQKKRRGKC